MGNSLLRSLSIQYWWSKREASSATASLMVCWSSVSSKSMRRPPEMKGRPVRGWMRSLHPMLETIPKV
ncbi:hypothetical protein ACFFX0_20860 [Citricoccus parietis]|uniref:Secreted protein n=1 Tax=Citricoccus parietis TaxID=592307 RepID=A0ABV5G3K4_9MICC